MLYIKIVTTWVVPAVFSAVTYGPIIFIKPSKQNDVGLMKHELVHVKQFWRNPFFGIGYKLSTEKRKMYEVEAYKEQLKWYPDDRTDTFAKLLSERYNLNITFEEAKALLK